MVGVERESHNLAYVGQTSRSLRLRFQEHIWYIRHNNPPSAYAQHILQNWHDNGTTDHLMTLLKPLNDMNLLTPYEQYFIQTLYQKRQLIPKQPPGEKKTLVQLAIDPTHTPLAETSQAASFIPYT
jgi:hypothetical protein